MDENTYIKALECIGILSEPAIRKAIETLKIAEGSNVLDVPCGTGSHAKWFLEEYPEIKITGVDINKEHLSFSKNKLEQTGKSQSCAFEIGDMNQLKQADNSFDLVWCCDGLWPGPKEMGCPAEEPYDILNNMVRVSKPGGRIAILFWSSQKLLPGYPLLEAKLNATKSANMPSGPEVNPDLHFMRAPVWLKKAGLSNIETKTFVADITAPVNEQYKQGLITLFHMFWDKAEAEVTNEIWGKYKYITSPNSEEFIINKEGYAGILTYTMFTGTVVK